MAQVPVIPPALLLWTTHFIPIPFLSLQMAADLDHDNAGKENSPLLWLIFQKHFLQLCSRCAWRCGLLALAMLRVEILQVGARSPLLSSGSVPHPFGCAQSERRAEENLLKVCILSGLKGQARLQCPPNVFYCFAVSRVFTTPSARITTTTWRMRSSLSWRPQQHF